MKNQKTRVAPIPTVRRMPAYLHLLKQLAAKGQETVSATQITEELAFESIQVRKDLAFTGIVGKPRVGYQVKSLIKFIEDFLGWNNNSDAFLVGAGCLGSALLGYGAFQDHGLTIVAGFDTDPAKIGTEVYGKEILGMDRFRDLVRRMHVRIGIICVPAGAAQRVADLMVDAGIEGIWNFTPVKLKVPENVVVQREDLSSGLAVLSVKLAAMQTDEESVTSE